jgi:hypothetical protein
MKNEGIKIADAANVTIKGNTIIKKSNGVHASAYFKRVLSGYYFFPRPIFLTSLSKSER